MNGKGTYYGNDFLAPIGNYDLSGRFPGLVRKLSAPHPPRQKQPIALPAHALEDHPATASAPPWLGQPVIPAARTLDSSVACRAAGISLISRAAATPTLRAYQSALRAAGINRLSARATSY